MIQGVINARLEATIRLRGRASDGSGLDVEAVIDSGFTGLLTLPAATIAALALAHQSGGRAVLADGSAQRVDIYAAEVDWDGSWRSVLLMRVGDEALVGMRLLAGHEVRFEVVSGGLVEIATLSGNNASSHAIAADPPIGGPIKLDVTADQNGCRARDDAGERGAPQRGASRVLPDPHSNQGWTKPWNLLLT